MDSFAYTTVFSALTNPVYASGFTTSALFLLIVTPFLLVFLATMTTILALTSLFSAGISMLTSNFFRELLQAIVVAGGFDVDHPVVQGIIKYTKCTKSSHVRFARMHSKYLPHILPAHLETNAQMRAHEDYTNDFMNSSLVPHLGAQGRKGSGIDMRKVYDTQTS
ncbi:hypothetical protein DFH27DRAFT_524322 [Peziza echinospora]|nr:hypothetical protein DFH27DRAFT_524322 [Peziza echinospora]